MIRVKRFSFALAFCFAASISLWGQSATPTPAAKVVYVATGDANVYAVTPGGAAVALISDTSSYAADTFSSLAVGPDNVPGNGLDSSGNTNFFLYACDSTNNNIIRLTLNTNPLDTKGNPVAASAVDTIYSGTSPSKLVCGRVDSEGDLYVSNSSGVYVFRGVSTATGGFPLSPTFVYGISGFTAGGITQKNNGDMLIVNQTGNDILRAPFAGANASSSPYSPFALSIDSSAYVPGLYSPNGIARISTGNFFVLNQGVSAVANSNNVEEFDPTQTNFSTNPTVCAVPGKNTSLTSLAASEDNFVYVGVNAGNNNKKDSIQVLSGLNCTGSGNPAQTISFANLSSLTSGPPEALAVPPVQESPIAPKSTTSAGVATSLFNFGSSAIETVANCEPTVTQEQVPISYLNTLLGTLLPAGSSPIPYNGEGGFGTLYTVTSPNSVCQPISGAVNNFIWSALTDGTSFTNPQVIQCDGSDLSSLICKAIPTTAEWPIGGLIPDDWSGGTSGSAFSEFFVANANTPTTAQTATFCGFGSPLTNSSPYAGFSSGSTISVKFKLAQGGPANCSNGPYITNAKALLSVEQVSPTIDLIEVDASGNGANLTDPFFSPNSNNQYEYSLSLKNYSSGTYALIVTFPSGIQLTNTTKSPNIISPSVITYFTVQ